MRADRGAARRNLAQTRPSSMICPAQESDFYLSLIQPNKPNSSLSNPGAPYETHDVISQLGQSTMHSTNNHPIKIRLNFKR